MAPVTMPPYAAGFIVSEANNYRSRSTVTVDAATGSADLEPGTLLGKITASGKYVRHNTGATDGSENVAGILMYGIDSVEDERTIIARDAEVKEAELIYESGADAAAKTAANTALAGLGIIVR